MIVYSRVQLPDSVFSGTVCILLDESTSIQSLHSLLTGTALVCRDSAGLC